MKKDGRRRGAKAQPGGLSSETLSEPEPRAGGELEHSPSAARQATSWPRPRLAASSSARRQPHPPALELRAALKLGGWTPEGDRTPGFFWFTRTAGPKLPGIISWTKDLWRPLLAALPQQFKRTVPVANPDPQGPKTSGATFSGREVAQRPASTEVCLTIFTRIPNWSPSLPSSLHSQLGESR